MTPLVAIGAAVPSAVSTGAFCNLRWRAAFKSCGIFRAWGGLYDPLWNAAGRTVSDTQCDRRSAAGSTWLIKFGSCRPFLLPPSFFGRELFCKKPFHRGARGCPKSGRIRTQSFSRFSPRSLACSAVKALEKIILENAIGKFIQNIAMFASCAV